MTGPTSNIHRNLAADDFERRTFPAARLNIEERRHGGARLVGHAAVFNAVSENLGGFREQIAPGAFRSSIGRDDIRALFNHDPNFVLGRNGAGTLRLAEDGHGLAIEIDLPDTTVVRDLIVAPIRRGDINQMSFGFRTIRDHWAEDASAGSLRTLLEVDLYDVSAVTFPAYPQTSISARAHGSWRRSSGGSEPVADRVSSARDLEAFLTDAGFARAAARKITAGGWPALKPIDADTARRVARARQRLASL